MNYKKIHDDIISRGISRGYDKKSLEYYTELHHIIPKSMGGSDDKLNLVLLTPEEHYVIHQLLIKLNKNTSWYHSALLAAKLMTIDAKFTSRNNKEYAWIKRAISNELSERYSGAGNPMYGKTHSDDTKAMWSNKRKGPGNSMHGKKRPEVSKLMSELKRGPHWKDYDKIKQLWIDSNNPGYVSFRKIAVKAGFPDIRYQRMIDKFKGEI